MQHLTSLVMSVASTRFYVIFILHNSYIIRYLRRLSEKKLKWRRFPMLPDVYTCYLFSYPSKRVVLTQLFQVRGRRGTRTTAGAPLDAVFLARGGLSGSQWKNKSKKMRVSRGHGLLIFGTKTFLLQVFSQPDSK